MVCRLLSPLSLQAVSPLLCFQDATHEAAAVACLHRRYAQGDWRLFTSGAWQRHAVHQQRTRPASSINLQCTYRTSAVPVPAQCSASSLVTARRPCNTPAGSISLFIIALRVRQAGHWPLAMLAEALLLVLLHRVSARYPHAFLRWRSLLMAAFNVGHSLVSGRWEAGGAVLSRGAPLGALHTMGRCRCCCAQREAVVGSGRTTACVIPGLRPAAMRGLVQPAAYASCLSPTMRLCPSPPSR